MTSDPEIPLLQDLIRAGNTDADSFFSPINKEGDMEIDLQIEDNSNVIEDIHPASNKTAAGNDMEKEFSNVRALLLDEEIHLILDNHMERAYQEITELLKRKT